MRLQTAAEHALHAAVYLRRLQQFESEGMSSGFRAACAALSPVALACAWSDWCHDYALSVADVTVREYRAAKRRQRAAR
jgi:hypothetical protein